MRLWFIIIFCLLATAISTLATVSVQMDEASITAQERREAQQTAQRFVKRIQETRNVLSLSDDMFVPGFISHFASGDEGVPSSVYLRLTSAERLRLFAARYNASYLIALDVINSPQANFSPQLAFDSILPTAIARKLRRTLWRGNEFRFSSYRDFQSRIRKIENALAEARQYLGRKCIERTPEFQQKFNDTVTDTGLHYRVRAYIGGNNIKDSEPLIGFPANQKFFRVETPLFIGVILVKAGDQMKIVSLTSVDGD
jgi:hypothetical protein